MGFLSFFDKRDEDDDRVMLGPELNKDPNFIDELKWSRPAGWSVLGGEAIHTGGVTNNIFLSSPPVGGNIVGRKYRVVVVVVNIGVSCRVYIDNVVGYVYLVSGVNVLDVICGSVSEYYALRAAGEVVVSYFSIKLIL